MSRSFLRHKPTLLEDAKGGLHESAESAEKRFHAKSQRSKGKRGNFIKFMFTGFRGLKPKA
ncbi:MAG: hypothetical protein A2V67_18365 [Deltaproteobacteria bacterium RBG_13_61_14]|nr:MAG: hypothetical protein A2V67_18365 [Deltaproteobacteria bacterium RBG_13_61_14]